MSNLANKPQCSKCKKGTLAKVLQFDGLPSNIAFARCGECAETFVMVRSDQAMKINIYCLNDEFKAADSFERGN